MKYLASYTHMYSFSLLYASIFLLCISSFVYSQQIEDYFQEDIFFTESPLLGPSYPGEGFISYMLQDWKMRGLIRNPMVGNLMQQAIINYTRTSNQLKYTLINEAEQNFQVTGFEIFLKEPLRLSNIGYALTNQEDVISDYFIIAFFGNDPSDNEIRLIAYFTPSYELVAEIVTSNNVYIMTSEYKQYSPTALSIVDANEPYLLFIDRLDQSTMAITNTSAEKIAWIADELSGEERKVVHFTISVFHALRFAPKHYDLQAKRKKYLQDIENIVITDTIIEEDSIIPPSKLQGETEENLSLE